MILHKDALEETGNIIVKKENDAKVVEYLQRLDEIGKEGE